MAHQTLQKGGLVTRTQQGHELQHDEPLCKIRSSLCASILQQSKGSHFTERFQNNTRGCDCWEKPPPGLHHQVPKPSGWTALVPGCSLQLRSGCRAEQGTPHPQARGHSPSLEKHKCSEKARVTEEALHKEQLCQLDPEKGSGHLRQCWGHASAWPGSPCACSWETAWSHKPASLLN